MFIFTKFLLCSLQNSEQDVSKFFTGFFWIFTMEFCKELKRNFYWFLSKVLPFHKNLGIFFKDCQSPLKMSLSSQKLREFRLSFLSCHNSRDLSLLGILVRKKYLIPKGAFTYLWRQMFLGFFWPSYLP